jgi:hypothetical protein
MTLTVPTPAGEPKALPATAAPDTGFLGILMLESPFPALPGDIAHADSFSVPTSRRTITATAWPDKVLQSAAGLRVGRVVPAFLFVFRAMQNDGARAITTSCHFLVLLQKELQAAVRVPVVTSSLTQLPALLAAQPRVGVLTLSAGKLGAEHLRAAGVPRERLKDVVVQGLQASGEFAGAVLGNRSTLDIGQATAELVAAAVALRQREPSLQSLVLESTRMAPFREAIEAATGLKTWTLTDDERLLRPWAPRPAPAQP